jgi:TATA-binding protein-associated factor Taf7
MALRDLKQEHAYEKKLDAKTIDLLENKVSSLLADSGSLKTRNIQFEKINLEQLAKIEELG